MTTTALVEEVRTCDGVTLNRIPVTLVRDGLRDGWLRYSDQVRTPSGGHVALDDASGKTQWPSAMEAAHRRFKRWQVRFAYTWTICTVVTAIWRVAPYVPTAFELRPERPWTSDPVIITAGYALTLCATRVLWGSPLAALGAVVIGLNVTSGLTGVGLIRLVEALDPVKLALTIVMSSVTGYLVAIPFGVRKERSWLSEKRRPIPAFVLDSYQRN
jgi:hypothetical protein